MSEAELQANIRELAGVRRWRCYHTHDSRRSESGFPDLVLVRVPRLIFSELKSAIGKVSDEQDAWIGSLMQIKGVEVYVWRPADWNCGLIDRILT